MTTSSYSKLLLLIGFGILSLALYFYFSPKNWTIKQGTTVIDKAKSLRIAGFYHVGALGVNWLKIVNEQMSLAQNSGLINSSSNIYVTGLGKIEHNKTVYEFFANPKFIYEYDPRPELHEYVTLKKTEKFCLNNNKSFVWYAHSKGATRTDELVVAWRRVLDHFVLDRWRLCYDLLSSTNYTTCSSILTFDSHRKAGWNTYYAGNMWWAKCSHINRLTRLEKFDLKDRYMAEIYVTSEPAIGHFNCHYIDLRLPIHFNKEQANCTMNYPLWAVR